MFTLRHSEPRTVLLWGQRLWLPGADTALAFASDQEAVELLVAHFAESPKPVRLRLVYQPDSLESDTVACPKGDRRTLAQSLAAEFPALAQPDHAWGHEPVLAAGDGFATVLHVETEPRLYALARQLAQRGLAVDSAWPLAAYLQSLPEEWSDSGAVAVIALADGQALAYAHPAHSGREIRQWRGETAIAEATGWIRSTLEQEQSVLLVTDGAPEAFTGIGRHPALECRTLAETLGRSVVMPRYHPAQLLPRDPVMSAQRLALAASVLLLLTAAGLGGLYARDCFTAREEAQRRGAELTDLRAGIDHLRVNEAEIARLKQQVEAAAPGAPCEALLERIATTVPTEVVLTSFRLTGREWRATGWAKPGLALDPWQARLAEAGDRWTAHAQIRPDGSFTLNGSFPL